MAEKSSTSKDLRAETAGASLVRNIAHELRNPLTNVRLAYAQLLDEMGERNAQAEAYHLLIERNLRKVDDLIDTLLRTYGEVKLRLQPLSPEKIVQCAIHNVQDRADLKQVKLVVSKSHINQQISADPDHLELALTNVLLNAVEAAAIERQKVYVDCRSEEDTFRLTIRDEGPGLPDDMERIFSPFYSGRRGGTGLGLTVTRVIIDAHEAQLKAENHPEGGAVFTFLFKTV